MTILVFDIGGTNIKHGLYKDGNLIEVSETSTNAKRGGKAVIDSVIKLTKQKIDYDVRAIGISSAGQINPDAGVVVYANENIPGYTGFNIKKTIEDTFSVPCYTDNDVNCAAYGELKVSGIKDDFVFITYGTGVGGAIVSSSKVIRGTSFFAGNIGANITYDIASSKFTQYEKIASTSALVNKLSKINPSITNGKKIFENLSDNVLNIIDTWVFDVTTGLLNVALMIDPRYIVIGGGLPQRDMIFDKINDNFNKRKLPQLDTLLLKATAGNHSALIGVANMCEDHLT